ncbi:hypothetical protein M2317_000429 [Microbacterium sp. ZKA21]|uniref:DUF4129 domain-containing protein n=1 Tax=Microbacterium sp. ZKA21 TaxID=3381694 RepID=UPI003D253477
MILPFEPFVPDGDEARRWAEQELAEPRYDASRPTWFDLLARDVVRYLGDLFTPDGGGQVGPLALVVVCVVIVAALIAALIVWGRPRASRTVRGAGRDLLGERDDRTAAQLRADAERAARSGDWEAATILRFRALARGLLERDLIDPAPGATAQAIARDTARVFPDETAALHEAASAFDDVRYLEHPSSPESYRALSDIDERLAARHPQAVPA